MINEETTEAFEGARGIPRLIAAIMGLNSSEHPED